MCSQLKQVDIDKNSSPYHDADYNYRKDGNLNYRTINSSTTNFTYAGDLMDTASGGESFNLDWDDNGNMTTGVSETFTYNWDNKLRSAPSLSVKYDPSGNRVRKDSEVAGDRKYIVDIVGNLPTTLMEIDPNIGLIVKTYIYANGQVLCRHDGDYSAARYFYIHDRLGSVRQIINTSGYVVRYYTYEPFGEVLEEDGTLTNYIMFTGQYYDTEIDQYYLRARQYDPHIYRFTSRDPVFGKFEESLTLQRYLYCGNNPINYTDLNGEWAMVLGGSASANVALNALLGQDGLRRLFRRNVDDAATYLGIEDNLSEIVSYYNIVLPYFIHLTDYAGVGATGGLGFVVAHSKEKGWSWGTMEWVAAGSSICSDLSVSGMIDFGYSPNAKHVTDLRHWFAEYGGSASGLKLPWFFKVFNAASITVSLGMKEVNGDLEPTGITLITASLGWGAPKGGEFHGYLGYAWVQEWNK